MVAASTETARAMVQRMIREADGDTRVAALNLASRFDALIDEQRALADAVDAHLAGCPQIASPIAREAIR